MNQSTGPVWNPPAAKIWIWRNETLSRLTLADQCSVNLYQGGPTDEGYHYEHDRYTYDRTTGRVYLAWSTEGRDCDGRHRQTGCHYCDLHGAYHEPHDWNNQGELVPTGTPPDQWPPVWIEYRAAEVYDEYAQRAGY